jgi:elongation factor Ts
MTITASMVKELRERTGSGMMECKKALVETGGDIDAAIELMRKSGLAKADKRAGKVAAEGTIEIAQAADGRRAAMVEINSETDFVAKGDDFRAFAAAVAQSALEHAPADLAALLAAPLAGGTGSVDAARQELAARIGENINVRRCVVVEVADGALASYLHGTRIGVVVAFTGGDEELGKDLAMHVAASRPVCVAEQDVPAELVAKEREIFAAQAAESGKPANIVEKMVEGRVRKYLGEVTLVGQPFVKNPDQSVGDLLQGAGASVTRFERFEVGEGIDKKQENFAAEVMAQVQGG